MKTNSHKAIMVTLAAASVLAALVTALGFLMHIFAFEFIGFLLHASWFAAWGIVLIEGLITKKVKLADWKCCVLTGGGQTVASAAVFMAFLYAFADVLSNF